MYVSCTNWLSLSLISFHLSNTESWIRYLVLKIMHTQAYPSQIKLHLVGSMTLSRSLSLASTLSVYFDILASVSLTLSLNHPCLCPFFSAFVPGQWHYQIWHHFWRTDHAAHFTFGHWVSVLPQAHCILPYIVDIVCLFLDGFFSRMIMIQRHSNGWVTASCGCRW